MYIFFFDKRWKIVRKNDENWKKVINIIKKDFESKLVYNEPYFQTKIKSCNGKINTNFHNNKIPKKGAQCVCLSVILIVSVYRKDKD